MRKIAELVKEIKGELKDADKYYHEALLSSAPADRETYKSLALQEIDHANRLHDLVVRAINDHKATGVAVPEGMQTIWNFEHEQMVLDIDELKSKLGKI